MRTYPVVALLARGGSSEIGVGLCTSPLRIFSSSLVYRSSMLLGLSLIGFFSDAGRRASTSESLILLRRSRCLILRMTNSIWSPFRSGHLSWEFLRILFQYSLVIPKRPLPLVGISSFVASKLGGCPLLKKHGTCGKGHRLWLFWRNEFNYDLCVFQGARSFVQL